MAKKAKKRATKTTAKKRWSKKVTETSDAMTLENQEDPSCDCLISQAVFGPKHPAKVPAFPISHVDAHLLRESGGEKPLSHP
jgi:hypothetical protein